MTSINNSASEFTFTLPSTQGNIISFIHFLSNNRIMLSTLMGSVTILGYDIQSKSIQILKSINANGGFLMDVQVSPDEKFILTAHGAQQDYVHNYIKFWDLDSGRCINTIDGHGFPIQKMKIASPSESLIYSSGPSAIVWDIDSNKSMAVFNKHKKTITSLDVARKNDQIFSVCKDKIYCWDRKNGAEISSGNFSHVSQIELLENGNMAAICGNKEELRHLQIIDVSNLSVQKTFYTDEPTKMLVCQCEGEHKYLLRLNTNFIELVDLETLTPLFNVSNEGVLPTCFAVSKTNLFAINDDSGDRNTVHLYSITRAEK